MDRVRQIRTGGQFGSKRKDRLQAELFDHDFHPHLDLTVPDLYVRTSN